MPHVNEVSVKDWADSEAQANRALEDFEGKRGAGTGHISDTLFRGQADQSWPLVTTLERFSTTVVRKKFRPLNVSY